MKISLRFPQGLKKALTLSYDDGVVYDRQLISVMDKYKIKGTFNINFGFLGAAPIYMSEEDEKKLLGTSVHEAALHGYKHAALADVTNEEMITDIMEDRLAGEKLFGRIIRGMAYADGSFSDAVAAALKLCGIAYARTCVSTFAFDLPDNWLRLHPTCHHTQSEMMPLAEKFIELDVHDDQDAKMYYLWGHSFEFNNNKNWNVIEDFCRSMGGHDDIWYATNIEICDYVNAYKSLRFSADKSMVYNPTDKDIWFMKDSKMYCVEAAAELKNI